MITRFADWDWAIDPSHPDYCRTWNIQRLNGPIVSVGAPWVRASGGALLQIQFNKDYTREKGWELLRYDFGAVTARQTPYFILYNKYTSLIRIFFFMDNSQGTYVNGALITMKYASGNGSLYPATLTLSNSLLKSSDTYLQGAAGTGEIMTYVAKIDNAGWVMGEFNAGFDPQIRSQAYAGHALEFELQGIVNSDIDLAGSMDWKTTAQEGYGLAGKEGEIVTDIRPPTSSDPATGLKSFLAKGQKVLGKVSKDDVEKFLTKAAERAQKAKELFNPGSTASSSKLRTANTLIKLAGEGSKLPGTIKKITEIAGGVNIAFGVLGSVVGFLFPSDDTAAPQAPTFIPTVSTGTLALKGSITTTYPLARALVQLPGTQHLGFGTTQPYYDCALGLFTLKNTPILNKRAWWGVDPMSIYSHPMVDDVRSFVSFQVANDLIPSYNKAAGLKLVSVQAAIVAEESLAGFKPIPSIVNEIVYADENKVMHQTPFVDLTCFKNMAFTANNPLNSNGNYVSPKIFVRIKAILKREDGLDTTPIFFVQDYAVQFNENAPATSRTFSSSGDPYDNMYDTPPFSNLEFDYDNFPYLVKHPLTARLGTNTTPIMPTDNRISPIGSYWNFPWTAAVGPPSWDASPPGAVMTFDHPGTSTPSYITASEQIYFGENFSVTAGTNFVATTDALPHLQNAYCGPLVIDPAVALMGTCPYNITAQRTIAQTPGVVTATQGKAANPQLTVYPNPSFGEVTVTTEGIEEDATLLVYDSFGRLVNKLSHLPVGKQSHKVSLLGQPSGIYIVRLQYGTKSISQKVTLQ